jgi:AraC family transcriptional regulator
MKKTYPIELTESAHFTRIERILDYIHAHIDQPLTVEILAKKSCWSRWQLQRIFLQETNQTVAQYVREIKLSLAAEQLLLKKDRIMHIALNYGFNSEISFNRAFKKLFNCTPSAYRKRGQCIGLKTPIISAMPKHKAYEIKKRLLQIRFENLQPFHFYGVHDQIQGLFSNQPNYNEVIPRIWKKMTSMTGISPPFKQSVMGIIDTRSNTNTSSSAYWAGYKVSAEEANKLAKENILHIPEGTYAVIPHTGLVTHLDLTLQWFLSTWLPQSNYQPIEGFDLEIYQADFDIHNNESTMECWIPIQSKKNNTQQYSY